jgi:hypothetical protein
MSRATCFDSPESSSGPHGTDPYNNMCNNKLWDPKHLQWYYNEIKGNKMNRNTLQGKSNQQRWVKCSESLVWG